MGKDVIVACDFDSAEKTFEFLEKYTELATGEVRPTGLPNSNVLYYDLTDDAWVCVRPSGTEPKVKFYYGVKGTSLEDADQRSAVMGEAVLAMVNAMM